MQEQLAKIRQDMRDLMLESQRNMLNQLSQLLKKGLEEKKSSMINTERDNKKTLYPSSFTPTNVQTGPQGVPIIRTQQYQAGNSAPVDYPIGSGSNPRGNPTDLEVPDLDKIEKTERELPGQLEDRYRWLEEKLKAMENVDFYCGIDAKDLSFVPDLVLPPKFKIPEFEKYNGTSCPEAHITMFCRRMTGYINNDQLLIHCFQDSLIGSAVKWYNQLSRVKIHSWTDLAQAFMKQYSHVTVMVPDRITLQNMEKKQNESFRQYAQRWREVATQVQPPLLEKETTMLFINTLEAPFIDYMLGNATLSFSDIVMSGEMIEDAIRNGKIDMGESAKGSTPGNKKNEVNIMSMPSKLVNIGQPRVITTNYQREFE
ncbi:hypothetical protein PVK06_049639 [Gossypium arboreum]|uniref:Retrotransposon gag domain-containing protein n=1 Tax=Gossypium arboreum TaxID=29729 RepID=A0ABR0MJJ0_GOSAR|nr:hypothetical protein PVK06_049639 [Gossypium arboreum]